MLTGSTENITSIDSCEDFALRGLNPLEFDDAQDLYKAITDYIGVNKILNSDVIIVVDSTTKQDIEVALKEIKEACDNFIQDKTKDNFDQLNTISYGLMYHGTIVLYDNSDTLKDFFAQAPQILRDQWRAFCDIKSQLVPNDEENKRHLLGENILENMLQIIGLNNMLKDKHVQHIENNSFLKESVLRLQEEYWENEYQLIKKEHAIQAPPIDDIITAYINQNLALINGLKESGYQFKIQPNGIAVKMREFLNNNKKALIDIYHASNKFVQLKKVKEIQEEILTLEQADDELLTVRNENLGKTNNKIKKQEAIIKSNMQPLQEKMIAFLIDYLQDDVADRNLAEIAKQLGVNVKELTQDDLKSILKQSWGEYFRGMTSWLPSTERISRTATGVGIGAAVGVVSLSPTSGMVAGAAMSHAAQKTIDAAYQLNENITHHLYGEFTTKYSAPPYDKPTDKFVKEFNSNSVGAKMVHSWYVNKLFDLDVKLANMAKGEQKDTLLTLYQKLHENFNLLSNGKVPQGKSGMDIYKQDIAVWIKIANANKKQEKINLMITQKEITDAASSLPLIQEQAKKLKAIANNPMTTEQGAEKSLAIVLSNDTMLTVKSDQKLKECHQQIETYNALHRQKNNSAANLRKENEGLAYEAMVCKHLCYIEEDDTYLANLQQNNSNTYHQLMNLPLNRTFPEHANKFFNENDDSHLLFYFKEKCFALASGETVANLKEIINYAKEGDKPFWFKVCDHPKGANLIRKLYDSNKSAFGNYIDINQTYNGKNILTYAYEASDQYNTGFFRMLLDSVVNSNQNVALDQLMPFAPIERQAVNSLANVVFSEQSYLTQAQSYSMSAVGYSDITSNKIAAALFVRKMLGEKHPETKEEINKFLKDIAGITTKYYHVDELAHLKANEKRLDDMAKQCYEYMKHPSALKDYIEQTPSLSHNAKNLAIQLCSETLTKSQLDLVKALLTGNQKLFIKLADNDLAFATSMHTDQNFLYFAAMEGYVDIAKYLYQNSAVVDTAFHHNDKTDSAFVMAARQNNDNIIKKFCEIYNASYRGGMQRRLIDAEGKNAFYYLVEHNNSDMVSFLLAQTYKYDVGHIALCNTQDINTGNNPLHIIAQNGYDELLDKIKQSLTSNATTPENQKTLCGVFENHKVGDVDIENAFLAKNKEGYSPIGYAVLHNQLIVAKALYQELVASNLPREDILQEITNIITDNPKHHALTLAQLLKCFEPSLNDSSVIKHNYFEDFITMSIYDNKVDIKQILSDYGKDNMSQLTDAEKIVDQLFVSQQNRFTKGAKDNFIKVLQNLKDNKMISADFCKKIEAKMNKVTPQPDKPNQPPVVFSGGHRAPPSEKQNETEESTPSPTMRG